MANHSPLPPIIPSYTPNDAHAENHPTMCLSTYITRGAADPHCAADMLPIYLTPIAPGSTHTSRQPAVRPLNTRTRISGSDPSSVFASEHTNMYHKHLIHPAWPRGGGGECTQTTAAAPAPAIAKTAEGTGGGQQCRTSCRRSPAVARARAHLATMTFACTHATHSSCC